MKARITSSFATIFAALIFVSAWANSNYDAGQTVGIVNESMVDEISGLAGSIRNPGVYWCHNDSGGGAYVYAMDSGGSLLARYLLSGAPGRDFEDIATYRDPATGKTWVYVADTGDNSQSGGPRYNIHRFEEPYVAPTQGFVNRTLSNYETITVEYPDKSHDAESLFVDPLTGDLYLLTKRDVKSMVFRAPAPLSTSTVNTMRYETTMQVTWLLAADISPEGDRIITKTTDKIYLYDREPGESIKDALSGTPEQIPYVQEVKGEALAFDKHGDGFLTTSEMDGVEEVPVYFYKETLLSKLERGLVDSVLPTKNVALHAGEQSSVSLSLPVDLLGTSGLRYTVGPGGVPVGTSIDSAGNLSFPSSVFMAGQTVAIPYRIENPAEPGVMFQGMVVAQVANPVVLVCEEDGSNVSLRWNSIQGKNYRVEMTSSMPGATWEPVGNHVASQSELLVSLNAAVNDPAIKRCFFRVKIN